MYALIIQIAQVIGKEVADCLQDTPLPTETIAPATVFWPALEIQK
jgi:hypothetical protein